MVDQGLGPEAYPLACRMGNIVISCKATQLVRDQLNENKDQKILDDGCTGSTVTVSGGRANINVPTGDSPMSAITIEYPASGGCGPAGCPPANGGGDGMFIIT